jgi:hypothetical protein
MLPNILFIRLIGQNVNGDLTTNLLLTIIENSIITNDIVATGKSPQFLMISRDTKISGKCIGFSKIAYF